MNTGLHFATTLAFTSCAFLLILASAMKKRMLRWKVERPRRCAGCLRDMRHCCCGR